MRHAPRVRPVCLTLNESSYSYTDISPCPPQRGVVLS